MLCLSCLASEAPLHPAVAVAVLSRSGAGETWPPSRRRLPNPGRPAEFPGPAQGRAPAPLSSECDVLGPRVWRLERGPGRRRLKPLLGGGVASRCGPGASAERVSSPASAGRYGRAFFPEASRWPHGSRRKREKRRFLSLFAGQGGRDSLTRFKASSLGLLRSVATSAESGQG